MIWLQHAAAKISAAKSAGISFTTTSSSQAPSLVAVQKVVSGAGLQAYITKTAQNANQVEVEFKACPFDKLLGVIATLSRQNIKVYSLSSTAGTRIGTANGSVVFSGAS